MTNVVYSYELLRFFNVTQNVNHKIHKNYFDKIKRNITMDISNIVKLSIVKTTKIKRNIGNLMTAIKQIKGNI